VSTVRRPLIRKILPFATHVTLPSLGFQENSVFNSLRQEKKKYIYIYIYIYELRVSTFTIARKMCA